MLPYTVQTQRMIHMPFAPIYTSWNTSNEGNLERDYGEYDFRREASSWILYLILELFENKNKAD